MGLFITFEGIEGCGKTTQVRFAAEYLRKKGIAPVVTQEPGGTPLSDSIRRILLNRGGFRIGANAEVLLFAAARAQHVEEIILPALKDNRVVLCDRFSDATIVYQGYGRGIEIDAVRRVIDFAARSLTPDLTLLFDVPVELGLERALRRISKKKGPAPEDRFEQEGREFHRKIRQGYLDLAGQEPGRFRVLDGSRKIEEVHRDVCALIDAALKR
ncbi:MAG TPA: dTMP kinase [Syntrophales bacterium]|nr:dTMP kinase [Syntrophales bacterium]HOX93550.1 dTMP kinase [Syntrophales bacterium]HPI56751.1 dTMP kinase [Syntrophales bacterium]HPN25938.1 dTMP kinase [Syntrophales bacterium]HQM28776.1 dTMP kinase [Syntrophales bacterium]